MGSRSTIRTVHLRIISPMAALTFDSVVLTNEARKEKAPLKKAAAMGGSIAYLLEVEASEMSLDIFIQKAVGGTDTVR